jgi:hypothetical protein
MKHALAARRLVLAASVSPARAQAIEQLEAWDRLRQRMLRPPAAAAQQGGALRITLRITLTRGAAHDGDAVQAFLKRNP